ncbi:Brix domain-containing protein [Vanrija pseudolonga]|uniref:Brix domain-containing protein n=1 Tax=Vanrija pseudolonga TaxID=143232 RepID=A0AAF0YF44_9TREE|nr:Brix domain-containing protein [Vanrija pseudolonga]
MAKRRRKNRTHLKGGEAGEAAEKAPKSFVIKSGTVTKSVGSLVRDFRKIMEPNTATRLRERPGARLRDYLTIAPTLSVTHLLAFTLTDAFNVHLRMARLPQGPTLTFRVLRYSLMRDIVSASVSMRNIGKSPGGEYRNPPLLVLNNFQQPAEGPALPQLKLMSTMFQGLFPPIQIEKSALPTFRRVLLVSYNHGTGLISLRHYTISVRPQGVSRRVRKLVNLGGATSSRRAPDLSNADDIADYLIRRSRDASEASSGYDSMSESEASEAESDTNAVELPEDYVGRGNKKGERKAVRLLETGPRLELELVKVVEGLVGSKRGEGETVYHKYEARTKSQTSAQTKAHDERRRLREARRAEQAANVARKKAEKDAKKKVKTAGDEADEEDDDEEEDGSDLDVDGLSDVDPEEELERRRAKAAAADDDDDDEFDYEDRGAETADDDDDWDMDAPVGEVASEEEEESSSDEEVARPPPPKRKAGKR